jgi:hypothetical protein
MGSGIVRDISSAFSPSNFLNSFRSSMWCFAMYFSIWELASRRSTYPRPIVRSSAWVGAANPRVTSAFNILQPHFEGGTIVVAAITATAAALHPRVRRKNFLYPESISPRRYRLFLYCSSAFTRASRASFSPELPSFTRPTSISRSRTLKLDKFPISISAPFMASHRGLGLHAVSPSGDTDRSGVVIVLADLASTRS